MGGGEWGRKRATDLPAGCVLAVVLSEHTRTVARDVAGCVWESNWVLTYSLGVWGRVTGVLTYSLGVWGRVGGVLTYPLGVWAE